MNKKFNCKSVNTVHLWISFVAVIVSEVISRNCRVLPAKLTNHSARSNWEITKLFWPWPTLLFLAIQYIPCWPYNKNTYVLCSIQEIIRVKEWIPNTGLTTQDNTCVCGGYVCVSFRFKVKKSLQRCGDDFFDILTTSKWVSVLHMLL